MVDEPPRWAAAGAYDLPSMRCRLGVRCRALPARGAVAKAAAVAEMDDVVARVAHLSARLAAALRLTPRRIVLAVLANEADLHYHCGPRCRMGAQKR